MSIDYNRDEACLVPLEQLLEVELRAQKNDAVLKEQFAGFLPAIMRAVDEYFIGRQYDAYPDLEGAIENIPGFRECHSVVMDIFGRCGIKGTGADEEREFGYDGWEILYFEGGGRFVGFEWQLEIPYVAIDACQLYEYATNGYDYLFYFDKPTEAHCRLMEFLSPYEVRYYRWISVCA